MTRKNTLLHELLTHLLQCRGVDIMQYINWCYILTVLELKTM